MQLFKKIERNALYRDTYLNSGHELPINFRQRSREVSKRNELHLKKSIILATTEFAKNPRVDQVLTPKSAQKPRSWVMKE